MIPKESEQQDDVERSLAEAEFAFFPGDFLQLAEMLRADTGIVLEHGKMPLVYARLAKRLRALGMKNFRKYCAFVATEDGVGERQHMTDALTTNVTRFFREPHHFEHLKTRLLPRLIRDARAGARVRLWSAGCSSGEEPYSIALTVLAMMPDATEFDIKILATDIDTGMLRRALEGIYPETAVTQIAPELRTRWLLPAGNVCGEENFGVHPDLRALVTFRRSNLVGLWPMKGPFQGIFCRNTVIYFNDDSRALIWTKMETLLSPGGYLYVGHSERVAVNGSGLCPVGLTIYRRGEGATP